MAINSKVIGKTSDGGMDMIQDILSGQVTGGFDIDSIYCLDGVYYVLELLFCDTVPPDISHPRYYFFKNSQKFISLYNVASKLEGRFFCINYEITHSLFKVMEVVRCDARGIATKDDRVMNRAEFTHWFQALNAHQYVELPAVPEIKE